MFSDMQDMKKMKFEVVRMGADIKIKCLECGHVVMLPRIDFNKRIKKIESY